MWCAYGGEWMWDLAEIIRVYRLQIPLPHPSAAAGVTGTVNPYLILTGHGTLEEHISW